MKKTLLTLICVSSIAVCSAMQNASDLQQKTISWFKTTYVQNLQEHDPEKASRLQSTYKKLPSWQKDEVVQLIKEHLENIRIPGTVRNEDDGPLAYSTFFTVKIVTRDTEGQEAETLEFEVEDYQFEEKNIRDKLSPFPYSCRLF